MGVSSSGSFVLILPQTLLYQFYPSDLNILLRISVQERIYNVITLF